MDNQKDNLLYNVRYKDNKLPVLYDDSNIVFLILKIDRIVKALYIISGYLRPEESLRKSIREISDQLLKDIISLSFIEDINIKNVCEKIKMSFYHIASLLDIGQMSGYFSNMNVSILKDEFQKLTENININRIIEKGQPSLDKKYFENPKIKDKSIKDNIKDITIKKDIIKDKVDYKGQTTDNSELGDLPLNSAIKYTKSVNDTLSRQDQILEMVKSLGKVSIKDIANQIPNISEKTIQRDLITLIDNGHIRKIGERRWSRYIAL